MIYEYLTTCTVPFNSKISTHDYLEHWFNNYVMVKLKLNTQKYLESEKRRRIYQTNFTYYKGIFNKVFSTVVYPYVFLKIDPSQFVKIPKYDQKEWKNKGDLKIVSFADFKKLESTVPKHSPYYIAMMISFQTGLRRAEFCGLEWSDIDFEENTLKVERIMIGTKVASYEIGTQKTKASHRTIVLGSTLTSLLKKMKNRQKENKLFYGQNYFDSDFVCVKENGQPVTPNSIKYNVEKIRNATGVDFNFHSFRHTHATMLLESRAKPKEIQARLGHSRIATTMDTYAHVTKKMKTETVDIFEQMLKDSAF